MTVPVMELVLQALLARLETIKVGRPGIEVQRNQTYPEFTEAAGEIVLRDGDPGEPDVLLSPLTYSYNHVAEVEVVVQLGDQAARDQLAAELAVDVMTAVASEPTLGGLVDYAEVGAPNGNNIATLAPLNVNPVKSINLPITLLYSSPTPL